MSPLGQRKALGKTASRMVALVAACVVLAIAMLAPLPESGLTIRGAELTGQGRAAIASLAFALVLWISEALPFHITGLLAILIMMLLGAGTYTNIVGYGFGDDVVIFFIGVLVIAAGLRRSGLAKRAGSMVLVMTGNSTRAIIFGFLAAGAFLAMWITALGSVAIIMPLALGVLTEENEIPGKSKFGTALMIASAWGPLIGALGTPAGSGSNPIAIRFMSEIAGYDIDFLGWMAYGVPAALALLPAAWLIIILFFPPEQPRLARSVESIRAEARTQLPLSRDEKAVGVVFLLTIAIWMLSPTISRLIGMKVPISVGALVAVVAMFLPGVGSYTWKDIEKDIDWSGILLIATGISLGTTLYKTGAASWVAAGVLGGIGSLPTFWRLVAVVLGVFSIKVVFSSNTLTGTIIVPLVLALGTSLGLDARGLALAAALTANLAVILVTTSPVNVVPYTTGFFSIRDMARSGLALALVAAFVIAAVVRVLGGLAGIV
ncbi:MAG: DASS family sodium-coupled anion symporter [Spirochaetia bacterium]|jgi:sodium-dependent dicarboxylate transporter 2/3/5|nr:DASS family sodium-coupled anion symporter [Spirochaetia bacterium]